MLSRPNVPVNMMVSLLLIKEIEHLSDEKLIESLCFDQRMHYALGITDIDEERICINTLTNFRNRLLTYEQETGVDLLKEEIRAIILKLVDKYNINTELTRMDSFMISDRYKYLSRVELAFTLIKKAAKELLNIEIKLPEDFKCFLENS